MRIIILLISLVIVAFLFYFYFSRSFSGSEDLNLNQGDTIIDTINYAQEAKETSDLQNCLERCVLDLESINTCQDACHKEFGN